MDHAPPEPPAPEKPASATSSSGGRPAGEPRPERPSGGALLSARVVAPVTLSMLVACLAIWGAFALYLKSAEAEDLLPWLAGWGPEVWNGRYWTLLTSAFVHLELWHLAMNMMALLALGSFMERALGSWRWVLFFLAAAFVSSGAELALLGSTGVGASGALYAAFGFMWATCGRYPDFARIITRRNVAIATGWLVLCVLLTLAGAARVANAAHVAGLAFGAGTGAMLLSRRGRWLAAPGVALLAGFAAAALFWCPWLGSWNGWRAETAHQQGKVAEAARWYRRAIAKDYQPAWAWHNLGLLAASREKWDDYQEAYAELGRLSPTEAARMEAGVWKALEAAGRTWLEEAGKGRTSEQFAAETAARLAEGSERERASAAITLGLIGRPAAPAAPKLEQLARADPSSSVRAAAGLALRRLRGAAAPRARPKPRQSGGLTPSPALLQ